MLGKKEFGHIDLTHYQQTMKTKQTLALQCYGFWNQVNHTIA